jgi:hypothetical protein
LDFLEPARAAEKVGMLVEGGPHGVAEEFADVFEA